MLYCYQDIMSLNLQITNKAAFSICDESTDVWMGNMKHYASVFGDGKDKAIYQRMAQRNKMSLMK